MQRHEGVRANRSSRRDRRVQVGPAKCIRLAIDRDTQ